MADDTPESGPAQDDAVTEPEAADAAAADSTEQGYAPEELPEAAATSGEPPPDVNLDLILDVPVTVSLQVGSTDIAIRELVALVEGSVVALERDATEPMDVMVNGTLIAHGEIVVVDDSYGVRLTDVVSPAERIMNINQQ